MAPSPKGQFASLTSVTAAGHNDVWAVGRVTSSNGREHAFLEQYNGRAWQLVRGPRLNATSTSLLGVTAIGKADVWAVGQEWRPRTGQAPIEHYNGTGWSIVPSPFRAGASLSAVAAQSATNIWAVGYHGSASNSRWLVERYNGLKWMVMPGAGRSSSQSQLAGAASVGPSQSWAVGYSFTKANPNLNEEGGLILHFVSCGSRG